MSSGLSDILSLRGGWDVVCGSESCMWSLHGARDVVCKPQRSAAVLCRGTALLQAGALPTGGAVVRGIRPKLNRIWGAMGHCFTPPHGADTSLNNAGCCRACRLGAGGWKGCDGAVAADAQGGQPDCASEPPQLPVVLLLQQAFASIQIWDAVGPESALGLGQQVRAAQKEA